MFIVGTSRQVRARLPWFAPDVTRENIAVAANTLAQYNYKGPVALSWDDTELEPVLEVYQRSKISVLVLGGVDDAKQFRNLEAVDKYFGSGNLEKAEKVRLFLLVIPMHKIPQYHWQLLREPPLLTLKSYLCFIISSCRSSTWQASILSRCLLMVLKRSNSSSPSSSTLPQKTSHMRFRTPKLAAP
ncbi:hypothetical protein PM082_010132 [Marasmius tenuissimus]|nr:hypothetical protein PM082_010132 [Marasmius tenuissimus]